MNILITGGTGLIGRALCAALSRDGHALTVLSRQPRSVVAKCGRAVRAIGSLTEWNPELQYPSLADALASLLAPTTP